MNADFKARWIRALVSGEYKQGNMRLKEGTTHKSYCCLGVACEIGRDMGLTTEEVSDANSTITFFDKAGYRSDTHLPEGFADFLGISDDIQSDLIGMNDGGSDEYPSRMSFDYIAAWIAQNL